MFAQQSGIHCVVVSGGNYPKDLLSDKNVTCIRTLEHTDFIKLLMLAKGRLVSAGGTILQCIALLLPSIAIAISSDQPKRLQACLKNELILASQLDEQDMLAKCHELLSSPVYQELQNKMITHQADDALSIIINDIASLLNLPVGK